MKKLSIFRAGRLSMTRGCLTARLLFVFSMLLSFCIESSAQMATCPSNIIKNNDPGQCGAVVNFAATPANANVSVIYSKQPGALFPVGSTDVTVTAYDDMGHYSICSFNVTVKDTEAPDFINYQKNVAASTGRDSCSATVYYTAPTVTHNCIYVSKTFNYTGGPQTFTVPAGVNSLKVDITGAEGGRAASYDGYAYGYPGWGGRVEATIPVTPGQVFTFYLGGQGKDGTASAGGAGGYNGGGKGGAVPNAYTGGGGGGASDIRIGAGGISDRIIVAGGGGGTGYYGEGGHGGGLNGMDGMSPGTPAYGGGQADSIGKGATWNGYVGGIGTIATGGDGAEGVQSGGGGAGYYGGGGGVMGDGAGGSSYTYAAATNVTHTQAYQEGNGSITFTWAPPTAFIQTGGLPSGSVFPIGSTVNTFSATDAAGNTSECTITVTVADNQKPSITAPANVTVNANDGSCNATGVALGSPVTSDNCGVASVTNDAPASYNVGTTSVTWTVTDIHGNVSTAVQKVTVLDKQNPSVSVPANIQFTNASNSYSIPALSASDNCGIASVTYAVTGATVRSGNSTDASGTFNPGTSYLNWTVTDVNGNSTAATTTVFVQSQQPITISMNDVWAVAPWGTSNTIYVGFGPSTLTLKATPVSGTPPYRYNWTKSGSTATLSRVDSLVVSSAGDYTVEVTDLNGVKGSITRTIRLQDVTCGNGGDKVAICHMPQGNPANAKTICVSRNAMNTFLGNGNYLGDCVSSRSITTTESSKVLKAYPNPTKGKFSIAANNEEPTKAEITIVGVNGKVIQRRSVQLTEGHQLIQLDIATQAEGLYLVRISTEAGTQTEKVLLKR